MARSATTSRHGRRAAEPEHQHSVFEERSVLDALWSAVVAAPTSVMPPASPDAVDTTETIEGPEAPETAEVPEGPEAPEARETAETPEAAAPHAAPGAPETTPHEAGAHEAPEPEMVDEPVVEESAPPAPGKPAPEPFVPILGRPIIPPAPKPTEPGSADEPTTEHTPRHPSEPPPRTTGPFDLSYAAAPTTNRTIWAGPRHAAPLDWGSAGAMLTIETPAAVSDAGLLLMRLVVGLTMAAHGAQKAFGMFGGAGFDATADGFSALGYTPGAMFALAAIIGELFGGLFLAAGLLTPLAAGGIIGVTVNAMVAVNLGNGFFASHDGIELPLVLSGAALGLLLAGPGRYSVDSRIPFFNGAAVQCVAAGVALLAMLTSLGAHLL
ncbi:DoxX family protein [Cryptosporangium arvum]|uniref:Putative membrane protein n=1 Tax=Cryptosporangium arvum DSM 44712 TaxID=927661 RepID=A0A011ABJ0_9ACTN|nr:DoxX family protein [Cryptosporangium arvum]EXG79386.1 putative membrane protein [Cryptosporangium arvum DSM 44712]